MASFVCRFSVALKEKKRKDCSREVHSTVVCTVCLPVHIPDLYFLELNSDF